MSWNKTLKTNSSTYYKAGKYAICSAVLRWIKSRNNFRFRWTVLNRSLFLAHPTYGNKRVISEYTPHSFEVDFESSRFPGKNCETSPTCIVVLCVPHDIIAWNVWWMKEIKRAKRLSQPLVHVVTARANLITDHGISGPPMRAKYKHVRTICEYIFHNSPAAPNSYSLNW